MNEINGPKKIDNEQKKIDNEQKKIDNEQNKEEISTYFLNTDTNNSFNLNDFCFISNNKILIDYRVFPKIAIPVLYNKIIQFIITKIEFLLLKNEVIDFHINLQGLLFIHLEKYFIFIKDFLTILKDKFPDTLSKCYNYNAPTFFSHLFKLISTIIDKKTLDKIQLV